MLTLIFVTDAVACCCNGILRGLGRQEIGGYVQLFAYYGVAMPISFGFAFGLKWGLHGLWSVSNALYHVLTKRCLLLPIQGGCCDRTCVGVLHRDRVPSEEQLGEEC